MVDRVMGRLIAGGGIAIIIAVLGIFVFILWQILPLFRGATVKEVRTVQLPAGQYETLGLDEWSELPFVVDRAGSIWLIDLNGDRGVVNGTPQFDAPHTFTSHAYNSSRQEVVFGTSDGLFTIVKVHFIPDYSGAERVIGFETSAEPFQPLGEPGHPILQIGYGDADHWKVAAGLQMIDGRPRATALVLAQKRTLVGAGAVEIQKTIDLTSQIEGTPDKLIVGAQGGSIIITTQEGDVLYFQRRDDQIALQQRFTPFADQSNRRIASASFLLGDVSLVLTSANGLNQIFSLHVAPDQGTRQFGLTKVFPDLPAGATFYAKSLRNKSFLIGSSSLASLRFGTTESVRWQKDVGFGIVAGALSAKYDRIALLDEQHRLHLLSLNDPHPESSVNAFFGKVWYEGAAKPKYEWQSTGGSDDFEPKLSLVPLIVGTLKGTLYAMVFALPIAMLAALYTSQFAHPRVRTVVKPTMEIMASLPSVVLGFLAALWLAPILETRVASVLLMLLMLPAGSLAFGAAWPRLPQSYRTCLKPGSEIGLLAAMLVGLGWLAWHAGPSVERAIFVVTDPTTGEAISDFRLWWTAVTGADFQQRNSLVVGFIMGFAVIPIIFTITEDSLSNVPSGLRSASLALGASRWQTALRVVVPTASAGMFSAVMIGLGRAVGETMIVLMATGNTPIMDLNIFSGMRTLSANIAVELPEAPQHETLYRTLFLGAMLLFLMTFAVNTLAELLRQHLRERYRAA